MLIELGELNIEINVIDYYNPDNGDYPEMEYSATLHFRDDTSCILTQSQCDDLNLYDVIKNKIKHDIKLNYEINHYEGCRI